MKRDLERRLGAVEARRGGPAAAMQRRIEAMSDEDLIAEILALERGEPSPSGMPDPRTMTDAELAECIAELERLDAQWAADQAGDRGATGTAVRQAALGASCLARPAVPCSPQLGKPNRSCIHLLERGRGAHL